jgi:hypothetical protein
MIFGQISIHNLPHVTETLFGLPYPVIQITLSIFVPLLVFYLGGKAAIKNLKKKELARMIALKDYYYLWIKDIIKDATKQNGYYKEYLSGLYKVNYLSGVPYKGVDLTFDKLNSIDNKDVYKIYTELCDSSSRSNAELLIKASKKLSFIDSAITQMKDEHIRFISYNNELRETWNKQISDLHVAKDNLVKNRENLDIAFFLHINGLFNVWYSSGRNGLKETFKFVSEVEFHTHIQYQLTPESKEISDLLFIVQSVKITYMMFHVYRLEFFKKTRYYYTSLNDTISDLDILIEKMYTARNITWDKIKSY